MTPQRPRILLTLCFALLLAGTAAAQEWQGGAAFGVRVTDEHGDAISGAQIIAHMSDAETIGPPAGQTDASGRAVLSGLREGEWFVEVSHPGYMLYSAYVSLKAGKKPIVGFSSQVNTKTSWAPMTVKFQKATAEFSRGTTTRMRSEPKPQTVIREPTPEPPKVVRAEPEPPKVVRPEKVTEEPEVTESATETPPEPEPLRPPPVQPEPEAEAMPTVVEITQEPEGAKQLLPELETQTEPQPEVAITEPPAPVAEAEEVTPLTFEAAEETEPTPVSAPIEVEKAAAAPPVEIEESVSEAVVAVAESSREAQPVEPTPAAEGPAETVEPDRPATEIQEPQAPIERQDEELAMDEPEVAAAVVVTSVPEIQPVQEPIIPEVATQVILPLPAIAPEVVPEIEMEAAAAEPELADAAVAAPATPAPALEAVAMDEEKPSPPAAPTSTLAEERSTPPELEPTAVESAAPAVPGRLPRFLRSAAAGSCSECDPGEWAIAAEQEAARASDVVSRSQCDATYLQQVSDAAQLLADTPAERLDGYSGPVLTAMFRLTGEARDLLQDLLGSVTDPESNCQMAGVVLPRGAAFTGYVLEAWDSLGGRACRAGLDCAVGRARWLDDPEVIQGIERVVVFSVFKNRSSRRERRLRMTVYFTPGDPAWIPRTR